MKKIIALIISLSMVLVTVPVSAATIEIDGASSYGKTDKKIGAFKYAEPEVTVPENIGDAGLPEKYDLREKGRVTGIKDQGRHPFCWAFTTMASLESNLITKKIANSSIDLSEAHLAYYGLHGERNDTISKYCGRDTCSSLHGTANYFNATAGLARGYGTAAEADFPYSAYQGDEPDKAYVSDKLMVKSVYELQSAVMVSADPTEKDYDKPAVDTVKKLIMDNGAVASTMIFPNENKMLLKQFGKINVKELKALYVKEEDMDKGEGHAITIIGWDDTFNDFPSADVTGIKMTDKKTGETKYVNGNKPAGPGAWIVKDSYGTVLHGGGYFYMSYYSACLYQYVSFQAQKNTGRQMYQYDGIGVGEGMLKYKDAISGANTFKARTDLMLDQLATYSPEANSKINFKVYINQNGKSPVSGSKVYDKTFTEIYAGYSRTAIGKTIAIPKGTYFSIVVTTKTKDGEYYAPFEVISSEQPAMSPAAVRPGQTYLKKSGKWVSVDHKTLLVDKYEYPGYGMVEDNYQVFNAVAKGFGKKGGTKAQKIKVRTARKMKKGSKLKLNAKLKTGKGKLYYQVSNAKKATVSAKGIVKAKKKGTVKVTIWAAPTTKFKSAKKVVKVTIR